MQNMKFAVTTFLPAVLAQTVPFDPPLQNFTQKLRHDAGDGETFLQQYQLSTAHFRPGGPILFHQSEEIPISSIESHVFSDYAAELGAITANLEHRYYGKSFPKGLDVHTNISTAQFGPLTLENILQDSVEFVQWIKRTIPGAVSSPVIHSGGSYGGFLSVVARLRHPETFHGALALSPVLRGWGWSKTLEDDPYKFAAHDWVADVYWKASSGAASKIRDAIRVLDSCGQDDSCAAMLPDLNLCTAPANASEWQSVLVAIVGIYGTIPQFDYAIPSYFPLANPLDALINATIAAESPGQVLRIPFLLQQGALGAKSDDTCISWTAGGDIIDFVISAGIGTAFLYTSCSFLVFSEGAVSPNNTLFPAHLVSEPASGCILPDSDWAGPHYKESEAEWEALYNLTDATLDATERLLIVNGRLDRTAALALPNLSPSSNRNHSTVITVENIAHVETATSNKAYPQGLKPELDMTRETQLQFIKAWIGLS